MKSVGRPAGKNESIEKKEAEYKKMLEDFYPNELEYIKTERKKLNGKNRYFVTTRCIDCGTIRTAGIETYRAGTRCRCKNGKSIRASAQKYAMELYSGMSQDRLGMLLGRDLHDFVMRSITFDRPQLLKEEEDYVELVQDFLERIYEREEVTRCRICGIWLPKRNMARADKHNCKKCYKKRRETDDTI